MRALSQMTHACIVIIYCQNNSWAGDLAVCYVIAFKCLLFRPFLLSTLMRFHRAPFRNPYSKRSVFRKLRFQMSPFSIVLVWTEGESASKCMRFHMKTYKCGRYLRLKIATGDSGIKLNSIECNVIMEIVWDT